jgi:hypothetical protein
MHRINYTITIQSPVLLADKVIDDNTVSTKDYIPGGVILGSLASRYLQENSNNASSDKFTKLFLKSSVLFRNAYICDTKGVRTSPAPMFIHKEKNKDGYYFYPSLKEESKSSLEQLKPAIEYCNINATKSSEECNGYSIEPISVLKGNHFHINTIMREQNQDGGLFHYEYIKPGQVFKGYILFDKDDEIKEYFQALYRESKEKDIQIRIGRSKNTEYGKASLCFSEIEEYEFTHSEESQKNPIYLYCKSHLLLRNEVGFYVPTIESLKRYLDFDCTIEQVYAKATEVETIKGVWKTKTPLAHGFMAGSSFVVDLGQNDVQNKLNKLNTILTCGLGCRRNEGYGEVDLIMPIPSDNETKSKPKSYQYIDPKYLSNNDTSKTQCTKNLCNENIPSFFKSSIKTAYRQYMEQKIDAKATGMASEFSKSIPSNSLLSKLIDLIQSVVDTNTNAFVADIRFLRKTASDQLESCKTPHGEKLIEFLEKPSNYTVLDNHWNSVLNVAKQEEFYPTFERQKRYLVTLFKRLRKINKEGKGREVHNEITK